VRFGTAIDMDSIFHEVSKNPKRGAPVELDYAAKIISFMIRIVERIPTTKNLISA
jgi:transposase